MKSRVLEMEFGVEDSSRSHGEEEFEKIVREIMGEIKRLADKHGVSVISVIGTKNLDRSAFLGSTGFVCNANLVVPMMQVINTNAMKFLAMNDRDERGRN